MDLRNKSSGRLSRLFSDLGSLNVAGCFGPTFCALRSPGRSGLCCSRFDNLKIFRLTDKAKSFVVRLWELIVVVERCVPPFDCVSSSPKSATFACLSFLSFLGWNRVKSIEAYAYLNFSCWNSAILFCFDLLQRSFWTLK